jgi:hypothetical protein
VRFVTVRTLHDSVIARLAPLITEAAMVAVSRRSPNVPSQATLANNTN